MLNFLRSAQYSLPIPVRVQWWSFRYMPRHRSRFTNLYHCTVHKAGSQWILAILADIRTYGYSARLQINGEQYVQGGNLLERTLSKPIPHQTLVSPLYIGYPVYERLLKQPESCAIFVQRDPRDLVVSQYFSLRYSHKLRDGISAQRQVLDSLDAQDGLRQMIDWRQSNSTFAALRSWKEASQSDSSFLFLSFEDMIGENGKQEWKRLLEFFDVRMPDDVLTELLQKHSFEAKSGRKPGEENKQAHYRKGVHGDWKNYFTQDTVEYFKQITGDLVVQLGYEKDTEWGL
jgi:hypothetical protein